MFVRKHSFGLLLLTGLSMPVLLGGAGKPKPAREKAAAAGPAVLWSEPDDMRSRNLFYGPGGKEHEPQAPFRFVKEDLDGSNPKFVVKDAGGVKWKVKLGLEARPETAATRIVWSVGYFANEDYFLPSIKIEDLPAKLHRGQKLVGPGGTFQDVRLKREDQKKVGTWQWRYNPFVGAREWNGLRTLMAVINNWDLKDENNSIYEVDGRRIYMVSDLGATFASAGRSWPPPKSKGNPDSYAHARFIRHLTPDFVDFQTPARPGWKLAVTPIEYMRRIHLEWIGRDVPRSDAKWMGTLLGRLSAEQIHDAFRAAGYSAQEVKEFSDVLMQRITALTDL